MSRPVRQSTFRANLNAEYILNSPLSAHYVQVFCEIDKSKLTEVPNLKTVESDKEFREVPDVNSKCETFAETNIIRKEKKTDQSLP